MKTWRNVAWWVMTTKECFLCVHSLLHKAVMLSRPVSVITGHLNSSPHLVLSLGQCQSSAAIISQLFAKKCTHIRCPRTTNHITHLHPALHTKGTATSAYPAVSNHEAPKSLCCCQNPLPKSPWAWDGPGLLFPDLSQQILPATVCSTGSPAEELLWRRWRHNAQYVGDTGTGLHHRNSFRHTDVVHILCKTTRPKLSNGITR